MLDQRFQNFARLNFVQAGGHDLWSPSIYFVNTLKDTTTVSDELTVTYVIRSNATPKEDERRFPEISKLVRIQTHLV